MKKLVFFFLMVSFAFGQKLDRSVLIIPPKQLVQINYPNYKGLNIKICKRLIAINDRIYGFSEFGERIII